MSHNTRNFTMQGSGSLNESLIWRWTTLKLLHAYLINCRQEVLDNIHMKLFSRSLCGTHTHLQFWNHHWALMKITNMAL